MRNGVGDAAPQNDERTGSVTIEQYTRAHEFISRREIRQADPQSADIRFVDRLVAGGRGLGGRDGFEALRCFAGRINAGIAASRMAVDLGWIEHERQVGQTGKSIAPKLYVACGISGANHHIEGMKTAEHIVAINTDRNAPIFKVAHLGLVADLFAVLQETQKGIDD
jgi:electron transfer flavoprotein alpha subunit